MDNKTQEQVTVEELAGVPADEVVVSPVGNEEKIVEDLDEDGNVIGWHKSPINTAPHPTENEDGEEEEIIPDESEEDN
jgi:hypothetical protein